MRRLVLAGVLLLALSLVLAGCGDGDEASPTATATPGATPSPIPIETPGETPTPGITASPTATEAPQETPTPGVTASPTATETPQETPISTKANVDISQFAFVPGTLQVSVGATVTWTNEDSAPHTVSSKDDLFDSGSLSRDDTFSYTFDQSGTFEYNCRIHPFMTVAEIIVE